MAFDVSGEGVFAFQTRRFVEDESFVYPPVQSDFYLESG